MADEDWLEPFETRECVGESAHGPHWWRDEINSPGFRCLGVDACDHGGIKRTCRACTGLTIKTVTELTVTCLWCAAQETFELETIGHRTATRSGRIRNRTLITVPTPKRAYRWTHQCFGVPRD